MAMHRANIRMTTTVELAADEFRQLVRDEWDWTEKFLAGNSPYSATALREVRQKRQS